MTLERDLKALASPAPEGLVGGVLAAVGLADRYVTHPSPLGDLYVAFGDDGVVSVDLAPDDDAFEQLHLERSGRRAVPTDALPDTIARHLDTAIAEGRPGRLPIDLSDLTEFQRAVLRRAAQIPRGEVRPYGWIAREIGKPAAVRAVGSALARNPIPLIIPCHRVVRSDGRLGQYSLGGPDNKRALLEDEGIDLDAYEALAASGVRFVGSDTTHIFCHPTCRNARRITDRHRVEFRSEADARDEGYRPCKVCRPAAVAA